MRIRLAKLTSNILNPFLVSFAVIILLSFESTSSTTAAFKWSSISIALSVLPIFIIVVYLIHIRKLDSLFVNTRQQRNKIYLLASVWAIISCIVLRFLGAPVLLVATFTAGLVAIVTFMVINLFWKISLHTAFVAASVTILTIVYGAIGIFSVVLLMAVGWARLELEHHSPAQVAGGTLVSAAIVILVFYLFGLI